MSVKRLTLAEQLAQLDTPAPIEIDREIVDLGGVEHDGADSTPEGREHYLDVGPSTIRKELDSIADPKYDGIRTSRRDLEDSQDEESDEEEDEEEFLDLGKFRAQPLTKESASSEEEEEREEDTSPLKEDIPNGVDQRRLEDQKKGQSVLRQIKIWDSLLDSRIRIQKSIAATSRLSKGEELRELLAIPECMESLDKMMEEAMRLSDDLFELQEYLLRTNENITPPPRKKRRLSEGEHVEKLHEATRAHMALQHTFHPHLVQTLAKWSNKIQAVSPSLLLPSNRGAFSKQGKSGIMSVGQVIDQTLGEKEKLLKRTQLYKKEEREDEEVFDDTDFYHLLLKDVIDSRGEGGDWMEIQRKKKAKKNVDTRASKGRKIRYEVHEKLQNFMVPIPEQGRWHEEQIDELFASLLGKGFERPAGVEKEDMVPLKVPEVVADGFRVFG